jgi:hypothetical protein
VARGGGPLKPEQVQRGSSFEEMETADGIFRSEVLPGFWLRAAWILSSQPPKALECLDEILAGQPA